MTDTIKQATGWMKMAGELDRQGERAARNEALKLAAEGYYLGGWIGSAEMAERLMAAPIGASQV